MKLLIAILCLISVIFFSLGCGSNSGGNNGVVNEAFAVEVTKLLTIQTGIKIDSLGRGSAKTLIGKACPAGTLSISGGCVITSFDGGSPVQSADSFLNQELQAFTCIIENNSQEKSFDVLVIIQTLCSDIN